jgi:hypothetical protein
MDVPPNDFSIAPVVSLLKIASSVALDFQTLPLAAQKSAGHAQTQPAPLG